MHKIGIKIVGIVRVSLLVILSNGNDLLKVMKSFWWPNVHNCQKKNGGDIRLLNRQIDIIDDLCNNLFKNVYASKVVIALMTYTTLKGQILTEIWVFQLKKKMTRMGWTWVGNEGLNYQ